MVTLGVRDSGSSGMAYSVVIIDDHTVLRDGLKLLLKRHDDLQVLGEAAGFPQAFEVLDRTRPDVIMLDMFLNSATDGVVAAREILRRDPQARILMLTMMNEAVAAAEAFAAGALGFATKNQPSDDLALAIRTVAARRRYLSPSISEEEVERAMVTQTSSNPLAQLTQREREVFDLLLTGQRLFISDRTVETHRGHILHKLGARTTVDLVRLAAKLGLIGPQRRVVD